LIAGIGILLIGVVLLAFSVVNKFNWKYIGLGALTLLIVALLKYLDLVLLQFLTLNLANPLSLLRVVELYIPIFVGLSDVLLVWLFVWGFRKLDKSDVKKAVAFGFGFGLLEAVMSGTNNFLGVAIGLFTYNWQTLATLTKLSQSGNPMQNVFNLSQFFALASTQILSILVIFYSVKTSKSRYVWLMFIYSVVLAYFTYDGSFSTTGSGQWLFIKIYLIFGGVALYTIIRFIRRYPSTPQIEEIQPDSELNESDILDAVES
jgi:uncharacterized membrane protein YhfC